MPKWNPKSIRNEYGRIAHWMHLYAMLGLDPKKHLPDEGLPVKTIQGIEIYVTPKAQVEPRYGYNNRLLKTSTHRVKAICPDCKRHMSAGRFFQHVCKKATTT